MQKRRAVRLKLQEKPPPKFEVSLEAVLTRTKHTVLPLLVVLQLRRLQVAPVHAAMPIVTGVALGIATSGYIRHWRCARH